GAARHTESRWRWGFSAANSAKARAVGCTWWMVRAGRGWKSTSAPAKTVGGPRTRVSPAGQPCGAAGQAAPPAVPGARPRARTEDSVLRAVDDPQLRVQGASGGGHDLAFQGVPPAAVPLQEFTQGDGCLADSVLQPEGDQRADLTAGTQEAVGMHEVRGGE